MAKRATRQRPKSSSRSDLKERVVDAAIELAETVGWSAVRLRAVAEQLGIPLAELQTHYRDLDGVADAWFVHAWQTMLAPPPDDFAQWPAADRLHFVLMRWFDALAKHREVTHQMLSEKTYLSHPHHWVPMIFNLSRTIQWVREAALLDAGGRRRQVEEVGLTAVFLATLAVWRRDDSDNQDRTRDFLRRRLARADRTLAALFRRRGLADPGE
ncbi:MAG: TetR/AcrR family transcriptional regulator [Alphaproteobacteria bacterium]|nr:TetR/AcrR family transcriptional regulator [Alphaproteobacteria bacterium]